MKVLFAGTPEFALPPLQALSQSHTIVGVYTQPDRKAGRGKLTPPPVKVYAEEIGVPVFQPTTLREQSEQITTLNPDVMVVVAYGMLLPQTILDIPKLGCINIHASLLPRWRGAAPIHRAIEAGDRVSGVSIMRMELGLDTGPVFQRLETEITPHETTATLHDKLASLGARGICETLDQLTIDPKIEPVEQDHSASTYAKKITKSEAEINWSESAIDIERRARAFVPWPGCQTHHNGVRIRVWRSSVVNHDKQGAPGEITDIDDSGVYVACGQGVLRLEELQREGSKPLSSKEFLNGYTLAVNEQFGQ